MRNTLYLTIISLFLVSCKPSYRVELFIDGERVESGFGIIKSYSDIDAYQQAVRLIDDYFSATKETHMSSVIDFSVLRSNGTPLLKRDDYIPQIVVLQQERLRAQRLASMKEEEKAFADAAFGMSIEEVSKLPSFKGYIQRGLQLDGVQSILHNRYNVSLLFGEDNELYEVQIHDTSWVPIDLLSSVLFYSVGNLKSVIRNVYGEPHQTYEIPESDFIIGRIYDWTIGNKEIEIGIERNLKSIPQKLIRAYANIIDSKRKSEITSIELARDAEEKQRRLDDASSMF